MLVRQKGLSSKCLKVFANGIKIDHLRKAICSMEFKGGRALREAKVSFACESLVSSQHQHPAIRQTTKLLQSIESFTWKQQSCRGHMRAIVLQDAVPCCIGITVRRHWNI